MKSLLTKPSVVLLSGIALLLYISCSEKDNPVEPGNARPVVAITNLAANASYVFGDTITFTATATDAEDGELDDSCLVWTSSIDGEFGQGKSCQIDTLTIGTHSIILVATDREGATGSDTATVIISENNVPVVAITSPADSSDFYLRDTMTLVGTATDEEDGDLDSSSVVWTSDKDGQIGTGTTLAISSLSVNSHIITLTATDKNNGIDTDSITIIVSVPGETFGGTGDEEGLFVCQTSDGGFVISGYTDSKGAGSNDAYLIKVDNMGVLSWEKTFGGPGSESSSSVCETSDGGYLSVGYVNSFGAGAYDGYLVKVDGNGNLAWEKAFGGTGHDWCSSVCRTSDGGYIITGTTYSSGAGADDVYLFKTDGSGNLSWEKTFGGAGKDRGYSVCETSGGGFVIAGYTDSKGAGGKDVYLIKTDDSGNFVWEKTFGGANDDESYSVCETSDGGLVITGYTASAGAGGYDVYLIKTDNNGNLVWEKTIGGIDFDKGSSVCEVSDGGFIVTGYQYSSERVDYDVYLVRTDNNGNLVWEKTYGGEGFDGGYSVCEISDGGFLITGYTKSIGAGKTDVYFIRTDSEGNVE